MVFAAIKKEMSREHIRWNLHERHLQSVFAMHFLQDRFCDVTLACKDGQTIRAHRTILCACSGYFDTVLTGETSEKDTLVIMKDCDYQDIQLLIQFMYYGEINVDEMRLRSLLKTADGLQVKGLTDAFRNFNEQERDNFVIQKSRSALPGRRRTHRIDTANVSPKITHVGDGDAVVYPFVDFKEFENKMDIKVPDWSDNEDDNDCVRVYLVSENDEDNDFNLDKKEKRVEVVPSANQMDSENGEDFNGWYLAPVDENVQQDERVNPFEVDSISDTKNMVLKNILSRSRKRPEQEPAPSLASDNRNNESRNGVRLTKMNQSTAGTFSKLQKKTSIKPSSSSQQSIKSLSTYKKAGTTKMNLLSGLQRSLQRRFDGRIKELKIDDLQNYSVENEKGSCQVKCPICDKLIKVQYGAFGSRPRNIFWGLYDVTRHINLHFK